MGYTISSGRYECGTDEQKEGYRQLLGKENIQRKYDLYFHWYNIVHELGHCLVEVSGHEFSPVQEEMYVNRFAVSYWRFIGADEYLQELKDILEGVLRSLPVPVPREEAFVQYYGRIWGTELLNNVMVYGYFQLRSVYEALNTRENLSVVLHDLNIQIDENVSLPKYEEEINAVNAQKVLDTALENMKKLGITLPGVRLELVDNPLIQCARRE